MQNQNNSNVQNGSQVQQSRKSGMKNSSRNTQSNIDQVGGKSGINPNINQDTATTSGARGQAIHQKSPQDLARHNRDVKPESDYQKGAQDEVGQDMRRSRQKATQFQEDLADE